jgi:hypothetical protein
LEFEPYTEEAHTQTRDWIAHHGIFPDTGMGSGSYDASVISLLAGDYPASAS